VAGITRKGTTFLGTTLRSPYPNARELREKRSILMRKNCLKLAPLALMVMAACTGFPFFWKKNSPPAAPGKVGGARCDSRASLELQDVHYDGKALSGRFLVGALTGSVRLDRRLLPNLDVNLDAVRECNEGQLVAFVRGDTFPPGAREEDLLVLERGFWFGRVMGFPVFSEPFTGPGPQCIIAEFSLLSFDGACVATLHARATREAPPTSDGGVPKLLGASTDAGTSFPQGAVVPGDSSVEVTAFLGRNR
jgi:hypothetical protein